VKTELHVTEAERRVLECIASGMNNIEAAKELHLSANTVRTHMTRLYNRFGVNDRVGLLIVLRRAGLLPVCPVCGYQKRKR
jgi:DNA-binding NarL/FixJ family response regulator